QHHGKQAIIETESGQLVNCKVRQNLGSIVCGDNVVWKPALEDQGVILAIEERKNVLARPDFRKKPKPFVANIDQIIIVTAVEPEPSQHLLDRYLVILETVKLPGIIVANKTDLLTSGNKNSINNLLSIYKDIGYNIIHTSVKTNQGLDELNNTLHNQRSILVGQSGVGKSTIINHLLPDLELRTNKLTQANHGKHTTSSSVLYHLPSSGDIVDSPGIRDFSIWHITPQDVESGFIEFKPYKMKCRFNNCRHINEPDCAVKQAAEENIISRERLASYQEMLKEIELNK
ncbi:MAG: ribosome small subunit-dependent GTPase A, partial [Gammaproteobacteria bacterium]|nr:ribosome small subunit-dependent GTPase A [Gammaproteobacteria bacterium]